MRTLKERSAESSWRTKVGKILLMAMLLLCIAFIWLTRTAHNYVYMFLDHYDGTTAVLNDMKGLQRDADDAENLLPLQQAFDDWKQTHLRDAVSVTAQDGVILQGGLYDAGSNVTAILLHPFDGDSVNSDYLVAPYYAEKGYNILLPDGRNHGESGGDHVTYGLLEGNDVVAWSKLLLDRYGPDHRIILHGCDLGANAALAGAAQLQMEPGFENRICFVVAESPIVNLYETADYLLKHQFGIPGIVVQTVDRYAKSSLGGRSMKDIDLTVMTGACTTPLLVIQPSEDTLVPPAAASSISTWYAGPNTLLVPACAHGMSFAFDSAMYTAALDRMVNSYVDETETMESRLG